MIRVIHPGSRIRMLNFSHPGSQIQGSKKHPIPDPGSGSATLLGGGPGPTAARLQARLHLLQQCPAQHTRLGGVQGPLLHASRLATSSSLFSSVLHNITGQGV